MSHRSTWSRCLSCAVAAFKVSALVLYQSRAAEFAAAAQPADAADVAKDVSALRISPAPSHAHIVDKTIGELGSSHASNSMPDGVLDQMILCRESPQEGLLESDLAK